MNAPNDTSPRADLYARVTDKIIADLERGVRDWTHGWADKSPDETGQHQPNFVPLHHAEQFFAATGAVFAHEGDTAGYAIKSDVIWLPELHLFHDAERYATLKAHELTHWTRHSSRLARYFPFEGIVRLLAREELVAELGSAFLCASLGVSPCVAENHAGYIAHWLAVLGEDKRAVISAADHARRAVDYLYGLQQQTVAA